MECALFSASCRLRFEQNFGFDAFSLVGGRDITTGGWVSGNFVRFKEILGIELSRHSSFWIQCLLNQSKQLRISLLIQLFNFLVWGVWMYASSSSSDELCVSICCFRIFMNFFSISDSSLNFFSWILMHLRFELEFDRPNFDFVPWTVSSILWILRIVVTSVKISVTFSSLLLPSGFVPSSKPSPADYVASFVSVEICKLLCLFLHLTQSYSTELFSTSSIALTHSIWNHASHLPHETMRSLSNWMQIPQVNPIYPNNF